MTMAKLWGVKMISSLPLVLPGGLVWTTCNGALHALFQQPTLPA